MKFSMGRVLGLTALALLVFVVAVVRLSRTCDEIRGYSCGLSERIEYIGENNWILFLVMPGSIFFASLIIIFVNIIRQK